MRSHQLDIELLKEALQDGKIHISLASVISSEIATDRSSWKATVRLLPDGYEARVWVTAEYVAPGVGVYYPLRQNDLVLVAFSEGNQDYGFLIKRIPTKEDSIPEEFNNDKVVLKTTSAEEFVLVCNNIKLGSDGSSENLVLGQVFKDMMSEVLGALGVHKHIGNLGYLTFVPDNASTYLNKKASPVDDEEILSDKGFTEK